MIFPPRSRPRPPEGCAHGARGFGGAPHDHRGLRALAAHGREHSVRRLNDTVRRIYAGTPTALRAAAGAAGAPGGEGLITLRLAYRPPLAAVALFGFLAARAVPGLEEGGDRYHRRALRLPHGTGVATLRDAGGHVDAELRRADPRDLPAAVQRCRTLLDLDADPAEIDGVLGADAPAASFVAARPGLRSPGAVDPGEAAVRAVLEAELGVDGGRAAARRLLERHGVPLTEPMGAVTHTFPVMETLAEAPADVCGTCLPSSTRATVRALAATLASGALRLDPGADRAEARRTLDTVPGISPTAAAHIRMRALHDPDVLVAEDAHLPSLVASRGTHRVGDPVRWSHVWRPYRSYVHHHVWASLGAPPAGPAAGSGNGAGACAGA